VSNRKLSEALVDVPGFLGRESANKGGKGPRQKPQSLEKTVREAELLTDAKC
jgi:hypothetical protein